MFKLFYNKFIIKEIGDKCLAFTVHDKVNNKDYGYYTMTYKDDILDLLSILNKTDYTLSLILEYLDKKIEDIQNSNYDGDEETVELVKLLDEARLDELKTLKNRIKNEVLELTLFQKKIVEEV